MWNPFRTPLPDKLTYNPYASEIRADTNSTVHSNTVYLDDQVYPDGVVTPKTPGLIGDYETQPDYDASVSPEGLHRELVFTPGPDPHEYAFLAPTPNSSDNLIAPRDQDGIAGTVSENIFWGPVDGRPMDEWQVGARQQLMTVPPGYGGPVTGSPDADYAAQLAYAYYQQVVQDYSPAAATDALVANV